MSLKQRKIAKKIMKGNKHALGVRWTEEQRKRLSLIKLGKKFSIKQNKKLSKIIKQNYKDNRNRAINLSNKLKGRKNTWMVGDKNSKWKGDNVGYRSLHRWVESKLGKPKFCEECGNRELNHRQYHWSNISGSYKRQVIDWQRLCAKCHKAYDKILINNK